MSPGRRNTPVEGAATARPKRLRRGRAALADAPMAAGAHFDRKTGRVIIELDNGCAFAFPARLAQGLEDATDAQLDAVELLDGGYGLHWEALDVDLSIPGLMAGLLGTRAWMARKAGQVRSPAKAAASRANGAKGGRPRKTAARSGR